MTAEPTGFLYPFIESEERDAPGLVADLARSARAKMDTSRALRAATIEACAGVVHRAGSAMADRFRQGGRLFAFGNGGSATDAEGIVDLFLRPPDGRPLPAMSLAEDLAVLTALGNDVGFELVFSRQIIAHARPGDIALGISTSGNSANLLRAFDESSRRGLLTAGLAGYDGGSMASSLAVHHCLVVRSDSVHRIQEAQNALALQLWSVIQHDLDEGGTT
ncbi:MAG: D-sedoheptulose-7-phosphate isomerase [Acidimicrobiales bacterium]